MHFLTSCNQCFEWNVSWKVLEKRIFGSWKNLAFCLCKSWKKAFEYLYEPWHYFLSSVQYVDDIFWPLSLHLCKMVDNVSPVSMVAPPICVAYAKCVVTKRLKLGSRLYMYAFLRMFVLMFLISTSKVWCDMAMCSVRLSHFNKIYLLTYTLFGKT